MTPAEQLHDLASRRPRLPIEVQDSTLADLLLALWSATGGDDKSRVYDLGKGWSDDFRKEIPRSSRDRMAGFGGDHAHVWIVLLGLVLADGPAAAGVDAVLDWLESADFGTSRASLLNDLCWEAGPEDIEEAAAGDPEALERCLATVASEKRDGKGLEALLGHPPETLGREIGSVLRSVRETVFARWEEAWRDPIALSAAAVRPMAGVMDPKDLIEEVTNGISYDIPLGTTRLILVPSVSLRPWTLVTEHGSAILVVYPVSDEHLAADPDAPPAWLVRFHKAVGDERRLRMLRRLGEGEAGLSELTELLGLAKSTVFHHIGVLRSAGLIRVRLGDAEGPRYTLRTGSFLDAQKLLDDYLSAASPTGREGEPR